MIVTALRFLYQHHNTIVLSYVQRTKQVATCQIYKGHKKSILRNPLEIDLFVLNIGLKSDVSSFVF